MNVAADPGQNGVASALHVGVVTLFPDMVQTVASHGVTGRACASGSVRLACWNPRDYAADAYRTVDDRPYGGGPGMVLMAEPLHQAIAAARAACGDGALVIALGPAGRRFEQGAARRLARAGRFILVAGRYEGIDERLLRRDVDEEWSVGDFVLSGGELAAMVIVDAVARLIPGTLGDSRSAAEDSFSKAGLDCPHYTRPVDWRGERVPEVLLTGDHASVAAWRTRAGLARTLARRPDLLHRVELDADTQQAIADVLAVENEDRVSQARRDRHDAPST